MKNFTKILILPTLFLILFSIFASKALAAPLEVIFDPPTLFNETSFMPGDGAVGEVTVTNNTGSTQTILTEAINISDNNNFGSSLHLLIKEGSSALFDNSLATFFSTAGEVSLGSIGNGETKSFDYTISFTGSDNAFQNKSLGFDVCVGFEGGNTHCGDTVIGGDDGGDIITGGGGGGGGTNFIPLTISSEQEQNAQEELNQITITWNTNKLATSQVVYGPDTSTYTLDLNAPNFGYPFSTIEDTTKVLNHTVVLTGLVPGQIYVYRVVSRASPPTISAERKFTMPVFKQNENTLAFDSDIANFTKNSNTSGRGDSGVTPLVLGTSTVNENALGEEGDISDPDGEVSNEVNNLALALFSGFKTISFWYILLILLIIFLLYLLWRFWLKDEYERYKSK